MNTALKVILAFVIGTTLFCLLAAVTGLLLFRSAGSLLGRALTPGPEKTARIASGISEYDLPAGFKRANAVEAAGFSLIVYTGEDNHSHIYFFQLPRVIRLDQDEIYRKFHEAAVREDTWDNIKVIGREPGEIGGQEVELIFSEGLNSEDQPFRQVSALFQGREGQALVLYETPSQAWDEAAVEQFFASIKP